MELDTCDNFTVFENLTMFLQEDEDLNSTIEWSVIGGSRRSLWTKEETDQLVEAIRKHGRDWSSVFPLIPTR